MHSFQSSFVIGPSNIMFSGMYGCTFQPGNFTGWGSEGVKVPSAENATLSKKVSEYCFTCLTCCNAFNFAILISTFLSRSTSFFFFSLFFSLHNLLQAESGMSQAVNTAFTFDWINFVSAL